VKPTYSILKKNHYSSNELSASFVDKKILYREIGYDSDDLIRRNPAYENTCAIRMSLALIKSGVFFSGRLKNQGWGLQRSLSGGWRKAAC